MQFNCIDRLKARIVPLDSNRQFFMDIIIPEIVRNPDLLILQNKLPRYKCPLCFFEYKWSKYFIEHLEKMHAEKLPGNGKIFRKNYKEPNQCHKDIQFESDNLRSRESRLYPISEFDLIESFGEIDASLGSKTN